MTNPSLDTGNTPLETKTSCLPRRSYLSRKACLIVIGIMLPVLLYLELAKPTLSEDAVLAPLVSMTLTRGVGALVFLMLLLHEG